MITAAACSRRELHVKRLRGDLVVVGGGLAGACCAITAARAGLEVVLVHDRPVLGGNASSEIRLWVLGATSHMGNNNRWAREGGVIDEILVENTFRNPEGNPNLVDVLLLEKVTAEPHIKLLLNTAVFDLAKDADQRIRDVRAFCSQNATLYEIAAPLFCDASGDGVIGFLCGAAFRMGAESREELGEKFAPTRDYGELLGHSIYFYTKDAGRPVAFVPPQFALSDITRIPRFRSFNTRDYGCRLWWIEYGGRLDTVHDTEEIKWELWRVVYGVWHHIKNSGEFPDAANLTLEWVGTIPGKRESRRFEGDYILRQQDIVEQREHADAVAFGGWSIDLHPADGVFSERPGCNQWHAKGIYQIPYRCLYSRNVPNLFLAGRIISASHVAFGSSRVMATCAHAAQAVGIAAALSRRHGIAPRDLGAPEHIVELQQELLRTGQHIPGLPLDAKDDLARFATLNVSSELHLGELPPDGPSIPLSSAWAMLLPVTDDTQMAFTAWANVASATELRVELRESSRPDNHTPDIVLETVSLMLPAGQAQAFPVAFTHRFTTARYAFVCFFGGPEIELRGSTRRITGVVSLRHAVNLAVAKSAVQRPPDDIGVDSFEFWQPQRRPNGHNIAMRFDHPIACFGAENLRNGFMRPTRQPNAWVADIADATPTLTLRWSDPQSIGRIHLWFDTDFDHPMETVLWGHPERRMPFCVPAFRVMSSDAALLVQVTENHQTQRVLRFPSPVRTRALSICLTRPHPDIPAALFGVNCYPRTDG